MSFLAVLILLIPSMVYASHESESNLEEEESCIFTAYIQKSWVFFTERPWVSGFVIDCDAYHYFEKDRVFVRILDINGILIEDTWQPYASKADPLVLPSLYEFTDEVYRGGARGASNVEKAETIYIRENQYFFYMPQIHAIDFEHRGIYQIEVRYGEHIRTVWFATLSPDIPWQLDEVSKEDPCIDYEEKLVRLDNKLKSLENQFGRFELLGQDEKIQGTIYLMDKTNEEIKLLKKCKVPSVQ